MLQAGHRLKPPPIILPQASQGLVRSSLTAKPFGNRPGEPASNSKVESPDPLHPRKQHARLVTAQN